MQIFNKPLTPVVTGYARNTILLTGLAIALFCGGLLLKKADESVGLSVVGLSVIFATWGLASHAGLAQLRRSFANLLIHLLLFLMMLCVVVVQFPAVGSQQAQALLKFLEIVVMGIGAGAVLEVFKLLGSFARDLDPLVAVVTSVKFESDRQTRSEVLVVTCQDGQGESLTPLRLARTRTFQNVTPGTRLGITFRIYPDASRQIAKIDILGEDASASC